MSSPVLSLSSVEKIFPNGVRGLSPVDLSVEKGDFVTLIGPSGCGKSTLLKLIANLHTPSAGTLNWWGGGFKDVGQKGRRMAFVFQDATLMPWATIVKNVRLPLDLEKVERTTANKRAHAALERVGLGHVADQYPAQLSGGMKMRVSIARALVTEPDLLLMDEPFGALDEFTRNRLDEEMARLCYEDGLTTLFVTHALHEAAFLSSRVMVMAAHPGRIHAQYEIDRGIVRDETFRLSDQFAGISKELAILLEDASRDSMIGQEARQ
ncbi:ABC transporter ATP-binding protein [Gluconobacter cerinus]|uniref:Nitrate/sulfonate/bicarbonate ABC transporter ATP-binding protein n=1 Tax=Gluconobacter cerinus TaxID=38307 RepID=A0AAV5NBZ8_9PROT|nr:ABC transporter ATP-binding protein [Gluconobacter cerinus]MBS1034174.1 ABC transporter ATP-binding protein [Gluconobacter cerinus]GBQ97455.1 nitrate/sulfonate/bicarbonate transporter ATP-binding protein [Gluconobacter cerinus NRIC 0229]GLQ61853.1 nitrate/sulfonate/bicarbonate ABC transporter ATP-binding protein [Gluconobacter cerinus]